ncbi:hypothetical protein ElyMa_000271800 [Elysia marginata]|uniref:CCHC-type domain-containing protein n=1 Tax=Elysia marginata TaxID=1093978 RepID=A0AAV4F602_9GAST|nr:hypothetical protein ElyMa_000271800 [Elysia marginata]
MDYVKHRSKDSEKQCTKCGSSHSYGQYPAFGTNCARCKKPNHWAKMCRAGASAAEGDRNHHNKGNPKKSSAKPPNKWYKKGKVHDLQEMDSATDDDEFYVNIVDSTVDEREEIFTRIPAKVPERCTAVIKIKCKLGKLYKALVKSVLTYNCGTWAPTQSQEERLNAFHRKQLKKVLNIKYPVKITNSSLYNKCNERPLSIFILESRWRLFGHILRRDSQIPANQAMSGYFVTEGSKFKGRPLTTLPVVLNRVINSNLQLKSSHDLEHLRSIAQQRDEWTKLTARIREAAEASQLGH